MFKNIVCSLKERRRKEEVFEDTVDEFGSFFSTDNDDNACNDGDWDFISKIDLTKKNNNEIGGRSKVPGACVYDENKKLLNEISRMRYGCDAGYIAVHNDYEKYHCWYCKFVIYEEEEKLEYLRADEVKDFDISYIGEFYYDNTSVKKLNKSGVKMSNLNIIFNFLAKFTDYESPHVDICPDVLVDYEDLSIFFDDRVKIFKNHKLVSFVGIDCSSDVYSCDVDNKINSHILPPIVGVNPVPNGVRNLVLRCSDGITYIVEVYNGKFSVSKGSGFKSEEYFKENDKFYSNVPAHDIVIGDIKYSVEMYPVDEVDKMKIDLGIITYEYNLHPSSVVKVVNGLVVSNEGNIVSIKPNLSDGKYNVGYVQQDFKHFSKIYDSVEVDGIDDILKLKRQCIHYKGPMNIVHPDYFYCNNQPIDSCSFSKIVLSTSSNGVINVKKLYRRLTSGGSYPNLRCVGRMLLLMGAYIVKSQYCYFVIVMLTQICNKISSGERDVECSCNTLYKYYRLKY